MSRMKDLHLALIESAEPNDYDLHVMQIDSARERVEQVMERLVYLHWRASIYQEAPELDHLEELQESLRDIRRILT